LNKFIAAICILVVFIFIVGGLSASHPRKSDTEQIMTEFNNSISDGKQGNPSSALKMLSIQFQLNGQNQDPAQIASAIHKYNPSLDVVHPSVIVEGNSGRLQGTARLSVNIGPIQNHVDIPQVTFFFRKMPKRYWIFFPGSQWEMTGASVPADSLNQILSGFSQ